MTTALRAQSERRIFPRHRVRVAVVWRMRADSPVAAEICDLSSQGMFVVATSALPDDVGTGDPTQIALTTAAGSATLTGIVRWRGFHPLHQAIGCGILLDEASAATLKRLFPHLPL
jgi:hypothetical protein